MILFLYLLIIIIFKQVSQSKQVPPLKKKNHMLIFQSYIEINSYIDNRLKNEMEKIRLGENKEIEKRYQRYIDNG